MENPGQQIPTVFDADNHYWETGDAFTRHRDPAFAERGVRLVDVDGSGKPRYRFDGGRLHPILPGPGDVHPRPRPGALYDYSAGKSDRTRLGDELSCEDPAEHPEWYDRDARLRVMTTRASRRPGCSRRRACAWRAPCVMRSAAQPRSDRAGSLAGL
jgi:hypothetical protein